MRQAQEQNVALISASRASCLDNIDALRPDNSRAARIATEYLIRQGHQRIAWIGGLGSSLTRAELRYLAAVWFTVPTRRDY